MRHPITRAQALAPVTRWFAHHGTRALSTTHLPDFRRAA